jgi:Vault protein inter-alpha-trypsin domain/Uncharacterized protein conserved in bacteria (DUF2135)
MTDATGHWQKPAIAFLALLLLPCAERGAEAAAPAQALNPELVARSYGGPNGGQASHPLTIGDLAVTVDIAGDTARTEITASFQNPTQQPLEGDFSLDLPPGAVITGYALDVNGSMVDGVLVGHRKALVTYQQRVRRGVDPGIAEVTRENAFRTHVFPIMPGRGRSIRLAFVAPLDPEAPFTLPFKTLDPVGTVSILVKAPAGRPETALSGPDGIDLHWEHTAAGLEAHGTAKNLGLAGALELAPVPAADAITLSRHRAGDTFFEIDGASDKADKAAAPKSVRIYWDRSLSRRNDDTANEIELVQRYLDTAHPAAIELVLFADDAPKVEHFDSGAALVEALKKVEYHGATSYQRVFKSGSGAADLCLFFSDGRATIDAYALDRVDCPLFTASNAPDAEHGFLGALARHSGGEEIDLHARSLDAALSRLTGRSARVIGLTTPDGADLDFTLLPARAGRFRVVGRLPNSQAVAVHLADGTIRSIDLSGQPVVAHDGLGDLWARDRLAELDAGDQPDRERSLGFARQYQIAAGDATFLVLESLQDYITAEIAPPESAGKPMQATYAQAVEANARTKERAAAARLDQVVAEWQEQKAWWARKNVALKDAKGDDEIESPHRELHAHRVTEASPPPADLPPPPPSPEPPRQVNMPPVAPPIAPAPRAAGATAPHTSAPAPYIPPPEVAIVTAQRRATDAVNSTAPAGALANPAAAMAKTIGPDADKAGPAAPAEEEKPIQDTSIALQGWDPNRPYLAALKAATAETFPTVFAAQEKRYGTVPAFYLDVAEFRFRQGKPEEAVALALDALELPSADTTTLTIVADRLMRYGDETRGIWLYERVLYLDNDRPQPRRLLALALIDRAEHAAKQGAPVEAQRADYRRAMALLDEVVTRTWDQAFTGIEAVALMEANRILPRLEKLGVKDIPLDPRLQALLDVDIRIVLDWYVDATDMDLWVDEPSGERAIYNNPRTRIGGRLSHDMTQGFGPEEYLLRHAPAGSYTVRVNIYRTDQLNPNGPITVRAHLFRGYGRSDESSQVLEIELKPGEDGTRLVGDIKVAGG